MRTPTFLLGLAILFALTVPAPGSAGPSQAGDRTTLDDLAWLAGTWAGTVGDDPVEEAWLEPASVRRCKCLPC
ncbi:MAG: hypothetical protein ACLF0P_09465 [Thermoanaerobaculia bacterium]